MGISSNASRIQIQTAAKNGALGTQGAIASNQIKFDTNISTNNSDLEASPTFVKRLVVIRQGLSTQEDNVITSVDGDGVTCTCAHNWDLAPASTDDYYVSYIPDDVLTVTGCTFNSTTQEYEFDRKFEVGNTAVTFAYMGVTNEEVLRLSDEGLTEGMQAKNGSRFQMGTRRGDVFTTGGTLVFTHNGNGEDAFEAQNGSQIALYNFTLRAAYASSGVTLNFNTIAGATIEWGEGVLIGITNPESRIVRTRKQLVNFQDVKYFTKSEVDASAMATGHIKSEFDKAVIDALAGKAADTKVYFVVEDV